MNKIWEDNNIQFPRLLAEIASTVEITEPQFAELCASMDLSRDEVNELFERAEVEWQRIKEESIYKPVRSVYEIQKDLDFLIEEGVDYTSDEYLALEEELEKTRRSGNGKEKEKK